MPLFDLTIDDIISYMTREKVIEALDDDNDGIEDPNVWKSILSSAKQRILDIFSSDEIPETFAQSCRSAFIVIVVSSLYMRRGFYGDQNPVNTELIAQISRLERIASAQDSIPSADKGIVISQRAKLTNTEFNLL